MNYIRVNQAVITNKSAVKSVLYIVLVLFSFLAVSQKHPLSKSDSGIIHHNIEKYDFLLEKNDIRGASGALNDVAFVYWNNNHYQEAAEYYEKSLTLNKQVSNENGVAMINNNLGMLYADLGDYQKSLDNFNKTLAARRAGKEPIGIISSLINMSVVLNNLERYEESVVHLSEALDISRELYDKHQMRSVYGMLSETYEKMGEVDKSLKYFDLYKTFHEEIQRETVKVINEELKKEKLQKQVVEAEKAKKENELLRKELEIYKQDQLIQSKDSLNQELYSDLSKNQIAIQLLENEKRVSELEAASQELKTEQLIVERRNLIITVLIIIISVLIISVLVLIVLRKTKKHAASLSKKNQAIEIQSIALREANDLKDKMFSIIAHDLRSPISSLQGFFMAIDSFEVGEELRGALGSVESQLTSSATLLDNLLTWSRSQIQNADPIIENVDVRALVDESFQLLQFQAEKKNVKLTNLISDDCQLRSDKNMINIVIRNLVQNAVKFTPKGGEVKVGFEVDRGHKLISISDTGVGMDQDKIEKLFDISTNRSTEGTNREKGSGLGLILCKELIEKIDGLIEVSSKPGTGSVFRLKF
ncbi:MAG: tetratricopeptide repeat protein [Cyclobacteriaceae bacterium]